ncbi:MAG: glucose-6-phosphate isomerase [Halobacteriaceae archaeon]
MRIDIGNVLLNATNPSLSEEDLTTLDRHITTAHERIVKGMETDEYGYAALDLPDAVNTNEINSVVNELPDPETVLVIGIGGSALGAATLTEGLETETDVIVLDNIDPEYFNDLLETVSLRHTVVNVVSRSGTTTETLANFLSVRAAMENENIDWTDRTVITTGETGPLADIAEQYNVPTLDVPPKTPGRFSVISTVGLTPAALAGIDIEAIITGAKYERAELTGSLYDCPGYAYGAIAYGLDNRGATMNAFMPYADYLERSAEWFAQLWAESLGKDQSGQTPLRALGVTDQHSQLQLYRDGPRNKMVTFCRLRNTEEKTIPTFDIENIDYLENCSLNELRDAQLQATEASLVEADVPNVRLELEKRSPAELGKLLYTLEVACVLAGELYEIDTFTQPAVEWGKQATKDLLRDEQTDKTAKINDKHTFEIES